MPRNAACSTGASETLMTYDARAFRCGFCFRVGCCGTDVVATVAGAWAAARVGADPRQKLMIAAAMNTLE